MYGKIGVGLGAVALLVSGFTAYNTMGNRINVEPAVVHGAFTDYLNRNPATVGDAVASYMDSRPAAPGGVSGEAIRGYLLSNPEVIYEAIQVYEQRQELAEAAADGDLITSNREEIFNDGYSIVRGNPDGDITMVEFADYNCGFCKRAHTEVEKFVEADGNIRLIIKEFPILGPGSITAARVALASARQQDGALYGPFNDALMVHRGSHTEDTVFSIAEKIGLDTEQLRKDMEDEAISTKINRTYALAQKLRINGTPAFIMGDQVVRGFVPADNLSALAEQARSDG